MLALFIAALDQTIVGPILADVMAEFRGGAWLSWVPTGFLMAAMVSAPLYGAIADIRGRRFALLLSNALFLAGSVTCALAPNLPLLVIARILQGAGAGGLVSIPFVVVADRVPMSHRPLYSAFISTVYAVAGLLGPLTGGSLAEFLSWRAVFWINVIPCLLVWYWVKTALTPRAATRGRSIDWPGALLLLLATVPLLLVFSNSETPGAEGPSLPAGALGAISAVFWAGFALRMIRGRDPLIPIAVLTNRTILLTCLGLGTTVACNLGLAVYLPLYFQKVFALNPSEAGMSMLVMVLGGMVGAYIPPQILKRFPAYKPLVVTFSLLAMASAVATMLVMAGDPVLRGVLVPAFFLGSGIGMLFPIYPLIVQNATVSGQMGAAMGVLAFMRSMGGLLGVSLMGMMAVRSGLATDAAQGEALPAWTLGATAAGIMALNLACLSLLPNRRLEGFGRKG